MALPTKKNKRFKNGEVYQQPYVLKFKEIADITRFQDLPELAKTFHIRSIQEKDVIVDSQLLESEVKAYLMEHMQLGPDKVVVGQFYNPADFGLFV